MPKFLIEREMPNVGALSAAELKEACKRSNGVLDGFGTSVQWVQSYLSPDRITCIYIAPTAEQVREHAQRAGFPATRIMRIDAMIDPTSAE